MDLHPKISILLPTHDRAGTLKLSLESLFRQSEPDWEVLVVGDGCSDGTAGMVESLASSDPRVRWFDLPKMPGFGYANRNIALRQARGGLIAFLADDDLILPNHLSHLIEMMRDASRHLGVVGSLWVDGEGQMIPTVAPLNDVSYRTQFLNGCNRTPATAFVHRRETFESVGYWDESLEKHGDLDYWQRIIARYGTDSIVADPRCSVVHFRAPWKRKGTDSDPHDYGTWQQLIAEKRLPQAMRIENGEGSLQQRLWQCLSGSPEMSQKLENSAGVTIETFAFAVMDDAIEIREAMASLHGGFKHYESKSCEAEAKIRELESRLNEVEDQFRQSVERAEKWKAKQREALARGDRWKARSEAHG